MGWPKAGPPTKEGGKNLNVLLQNKKALAALIAIAGLLAVSIGTASAGAGPGLDMRFGPAGVGSEDGRYWGWNQLHPWQHNVVVIDANRGSNRYNDGGLDWFDPKLANPSLEDYANGHKPYLVDLIIDIGSGGFGHYNPLTGEGGGAGDWYISPYGDIADALEAAGSFCNDSYRTPCDIVLITYQAPESLNHQRHAMAEAMQLAADGHSLHTVAMGDPTAPGAEILADSHYNFSALLGANGFHALTDIHGAAETIGYIVEQRFRQPDFNEYEVDGPEPGPSPDDCWDVEYDWCEVEVDCEVYDPDGYCYWGTDDVVPGNGVGIGFVANHVDETNWISLVEAEGNAELVEFRYAVSDQDIDCDDSIPTPEVATKQGILVDEDDIGQYYCLRVEFADGDVQFLNHQLESRDITRFDEEAEADSDQPCWDEEYGIDWCGGYEDTSEADELYYELSEYAQDQICNYPGLDELSAEFDEFIQWLIEDLIDYVETNYPDLDVVSEFGDGWPEMFVGASEGLGEICSGPPAPTAPTPPDAPVVWDGNV